MEASVRVFNSSNLNRHILSRHSLKFPPKIHYSTLSNSSRNYENPVSAIACAPSNRDNLVLRNRYCNCNLVRSSSFAVSRSSFPSPSSNPLGFLLSLSSSQILNSHVSDERFDRVASDPDERFFAWNRAPAGINGGDLGVLGERGPVLTVVLLGWLGAKQKHLQRYVDLYTSRGIHAVTFVVPVRDVLGFDLGRRVEKRISELTQELVSWLSETEEDGKKRSLLFHTFSNTGWLSYGAILDNLQRRGDFVDKIKGCVIDSGGDPEINPQVWAAGFSAAFLKKHSSSAYPSVEVIEGNEVESQKGVSKMQEKKLPMIETVLLSALQKFFSVILKLPDVNRRLTKIISSLSNNQPPCPQMYLYSTADKVIPFQSVELFIQEQKRTGRKVWSYNFGSSPHVDHYRSFPRIYSAQLHKFLKECVATVSQK
ncbi:hypothetical protein HHK36_031307 [Tetracentron sinense]|uniref:Transmembrane protein 53 n=1 Tax=Tetracentron sinense TaxID=13715 RepID=A0A834YEH0_TETSI|nr:hypothetical protein HHK36_031307 [Tetracentron sinense]